MKCLMAEHNIVLKAVHFCLMHVLISICFICCVFCVHRLVCGLALIISLTRWLRYSSSDLLWGPWISFYLEGADESSHGKLRKWMYVIWNIYDINMLKVLSRSLLSKFHWFHCFRGKRRKSSTSGEKGVSCGLKGFPWTLVVLVYGVPH